MFYVVQICYVVFKNGYASFGIFSTETLGLYLLLLNLDRIEISLTYMQDSRNETLTFEDRS